MADHIDRAQELDAAFREEAVAAQRGQGAHGRGRATCLDCGEKIPAARRAANVGAVRCVDCQTEFERRG